MRTKYRTRVIFFLGRSMTVFGNKKTTFPSFKNNLLQLTKKKKKKKKNGQNRGKQDLPFGLFVTSHIELHMVDEVYVYIFSAPTQ